MMHTPKIARAISKLPARALLVMLALIAVRSDTVSLIDIDPSEEEVNIGETFGTKDPRPINPTTMSLLVL